MGEGDGHGEGMEPIRKQKRRSRGGAAAPRKFRGAPRSGRPRALLRVGDRRILPPALVPTLKCHLVRVGAREKEGEQVFPVETPIFEMCLVERVEEAQGKHFLGFLFVCFLFPLNFETRFQHLLLPISGVF